MVPGSRGRPDRVPPPARLSRPGRGPARRSQGPRGGPRGRRPPPAGGRAAPSCNPRVRRLATRRCASRKASPRRRPSLTSSRAFTAPPSSRYHRAAQLPAAAGHPARRGRIAGVASENPRTQRRSLNPGRGPKPGRPGRAKRKTQGRKGSKGAKPPPGRETQSAEAQRRKEEMLPAMRGRLHSALTSRLLRGKKHENRAGTERLARQEHRRAANALQPVAGSQQGAGKGSGSRGTVPHLPPPSPLCGFASLRLCVSLRWWAASAPRRLRFPARGVAVIEVNPRWRSPRRSSPSPSRAAPGPAGKRQQGRNPGHAVLRRRPLAEPDRAAAAADPRPPGHPGQPHGVMRVVCQRHRTQPATSAVRSSASSSCSRRRSPRRAAVETAVSAPGQAPAPRGQAPDSRAKQLRARPGDEE